MTFRQDQSPGPPTHPGPAWTAARVVALALIAVVVLGLAFVRFTSSGPESVSVPAGAHAGQLTLEPCSYPTENGDLPADCGTLVVPENRANPQSRLIALPVTRIRARSAHPAEPVFRLEGGPGKTNLEVPTAGRFAEDRDVVLVGYRGADGSVRLDCPEVDAALKHSAGVLDERQFRPHADGFRACAERHAGDGVDLAGYGLVPQADDVEAARVALGYGRINLLSESAGTRLAMVYAWRYPESLYRSVMVAVNPPGHFFWDAKTIDEQVARYADLCAQDESCRQRTHDLVATMRQVNADLPKRWGFLPIKESNVRAAGFTGLMESTSRGAPVSGPMVIDAWLSAAAGDASGLWFASLIGDLLFPTLFTWGEYASVGIVDAAAVRDHFASLGPESMRNLGEAGSAYFWAGALLADAWPAAPDAEAYSRVRESTAETLLIGGALDFAAPPQVATRELLPHLPKGRQVVLPGFGHTGTIWSEQPAASSRLINTFLDSGRVDTSLYRPGNVDFTPTVPLTSIAKGLVGAMVGLALLTVLSLVGMARRVRRGRRFGPVASATLRSGYPLVLGLGGWCLGVLVLRTALPTVALDDAWLVALAVGLPVGLGVCLAWVNPRRGGRGQAAEFAAGLAGALVGAWLGFSVTDGLLALLTAIAGAVGGGNLVLLALDLAGEGQAGDRSTPTAAPEPVLTHVSVR